MTDKSYFIHSLVLVLPLALGCTVDGYGEGPAPSGPDGGGAVARCTPDNVVSTVIAERCTGGACHDNSDPAAGLDLISPSLPDRLMNQASNMCSDQVLVVAGFPSQSYLMQKLGGAPTCGDPMPKGGPALTIEEKDCIEGWIEQLNPNGGTGGSGGGTGGDTGGGGTGGGGGGW